MIDIALLIAVTIGVTELLKQALKIDNRYLPLVSLVLGIVGGIVYLDGTLAESVLQGIIVGLSASGLFDHTKIVRSDK